jgi:hypothetical protein
MKKSYEIIEWSDTYHRLQQLEVQQVQRREKMWPWWEKTWILPSGEAYRFESRKEVTIIQFNSTTKANKLNKQKFLLNNTI